MSNLFVIGITGGVGAGKTSFLQYLKEKYDAVLLIADAIAGTFRLPGGKIYNEIVKEFGTGILNEDTTINNARLADILFESEANVQKMDAIVHPAVVNYMAERIEAERLEAYISASDSPRLVIIEAAILFEGNAAHLCDDIWYIRTSEDIRIERLMKNRGYSLEKCHNIIDNQMSDQEFLEKCSYVISNDGEPAEAFPAVDERIEYLKGANND